MLRSGVRHRRRRHIPSLNVFASSMNDINFIIFCSSLTHRNHLPTCDNATIGRLCMKEGPIKFIIFYMRTEKCLNFRCSVNYCT